MTKFKKVSGFCPHLNKEHSISVELANQSTKAMLGWKPIRFECNLEKQCQNPNACPIAANLPAVYQHYYNADLANEEE